MILTCPECYARYVVNPKALLPSGRVVRCAKCKHSWKEAAPDEHIPLTDDAEANMENQPAKSEKQAPPANNDEDDFAIKRARRKKRARPMPKGSNLPALQNHKHGDILWGWYGLGAFVAVIVSSFLIFQTTITDIWPPSQKLYRTLGMDNDTLGQDGYNKPDMKENIPLDKLFRIKDTALKKVKNGPVITLKINGNIVNLTDETRPLPLLRIALKNNQGVVIREWTFKSSAATISEDEIVPFATSLSNPPDDATSISVNFSRE